MPAPRLWLKTSPSKFYLMKIAIVGLGYVGLPLALAFVEKGV
jgi:UDP-N-acetyl-D-mannosaminuronate dehydrogenase